MKYVEEFGKNIERPHIIQIDGEDVWNFYIQNIEPFDNWMLPEMKAWLENLPPVPKYSWLPSWSPWKPTIPAAHGSRPFASVFLQVNQYGRGVGQENRWCAQICFARREDAMQFKLVWR